MSEACEQEFQQAYTGMPDGPHNVAAAADSGDGAAAALLHYLHHGLF
jgi:hypothetical protein